MRPDDDSTQADDGTAKHRDPRSAPAAGPGSGGPRHAAPDDAGPRPLIDLTRDPTPGVPDHAAPEDPEDAAGGA